MTIDEAIKFCHEKAENIKLKAEPQVFVDIAEMLEDYRLSLKMRELNAEHLPKIEESIRKIELMKEYEKAYNRAIDDFAEKMSNECFEQSMTVVFENRVKADVLTLDGLTEIIFEIAEQLKAGASDD